MMAQFPNIESIGSIGSIILAILEVQEDAESSSSCTRKLRGPTRFSCAMRSRPPPDKAQRPQKLEPGPQKYPKRRPIYPGIKVCIFGTLKITTIARSRRYRAKYPNLHSVSKAQDKVDSRNQGL